MSNEYSLVFEIQYSSSYHTYIYIEHYLNIMFTIWKLKLFKL